jgi:membrane associated rhomboid family serine protease
MIEQSTPPTGEDAPPPMMASRTAEEANAAQRAAYDRARAAAHAPRDVSSKKGLLYAYIGMAIAVVVLTVAGGIISGASGALIGFIAGIVIVLIGSVPVWMASRSYANERKTGRRL